MALSDQRKEELCYALALVCLASLVNYVYLEYQLGTNYKAFKQTMAFLVWQQHQQTYLPVLALMAVVSFGLRWRLGLRAALTTRRGRVVLGTAVVVLLFVSVGLYQMYGPSLPAGVVSEPAYY